MNAVLRPIEKEVRALMVPWMAAAALFGVPLLLEWRVRPVFGIVVFTASAIVLGAMSIGHELSDRTLGWALAHPVSRSRLLATKVGVAALMLTALALMVNLLDGMDLRISREFPNDWVPLAVTLGIDGLLLALWFTLVTRDPLAGVVLAGAALALVWRLPALLVIPGAFEVSVRVWALRGLAVLGALAGWYTFTRLEVTDGSRSLDLTAWWPVARGRASAFETQSSVQRSPLWQLAWKELHLQQLSLAAAGIYFAVSGIAIVANRAGLGLPGFTIVNSVYGTLASVMFGSMAIAEERRSGVWGWQASLPIRAWKQWALKLNVALGSKLLLVSGLQLLIFLSVSPYEFGSLEEYEALVHSLAYSLAVGVGMTILAFYVSSFSSSGIRASLVTLVTIVVMQILIQSTLMFISRFGFGASQTLALTPPIQFVIAAGVAAVMLRLSFINYKYSDPVSGVPRQAMALAASVIAVVALATIVVGVIG